MPTEQIIDRIRRALMLDSAAYEEVRDDAAFTPYALGLGAIAALLGGIGSFLWASVILNDTSDFFLEATILGTLFLIFLWLAGILLAYVILNQLWREDITVDGLIRVMAVAHIPFAVSLLVFIPVLSFAFAILAVAAMFFYANFGLRAAYPAIEPVRVLGAVTAAFAVWLIILPLLTSRDNEYAPGTFVYEWSADVVKDIADITSDFRSLLPSQ